MKQNVFGTVSRRNLVCMSAAGAAAAMVFGLPVASGLADEPSAAYKAGSYTATANGKGGPLTVEVTFDSASIKDVSVIDHHETRYVSDVALEEIPAQIVAYQSLGVDSVSGATMTSFAILSAVEDCVSQAGGDVEALRKAPVSEKVEKAVELDADLVVVGAGGAGMAAAVAGAQAGKSVVVLEKTSNMGGNAVICGGYVHYIHAPQELRQPMTEGYAEYFESMLQRGLDEGAERGITPEYIEGIRKDYDDYYAAGNTTVFDSEEFCALEYQFTNGGTFDKWVNFIGTVPPLNEWLTEMGIDWYPLTPIVGFPWPRWSGQQGAVMGQGYFDLFQGEIADKELPITLLTCTPVTELIVEDGRVTGVVGACTDGTTYTVHSANGVILATGGYSGNSEMLKKYNTFWKWDEDAYIPTDNTAGHSGDGIEMALSLGAELGHMENPMMMPYGDPKLFLLDTLVGDNTNCMMVNTDGKRFVNEKGTRYEMSQAMFDSKDAMGFIISDANNSFVADGKTMFGWDVEYLINNGQLFMADSIEELAEAFGADPETLAAEVEKYNGYARKQTGKADEFGRTVFTDASLIETPPFYACPRTPVAHITVGGVVVDEEDYCALTGNGERIEGLHCVGELAAERSGLPSMATGLYTVKKIFGLE